jgi:hypothetical protein
MSTLKSAEEWVVTNPHQEKVSGEPVRTFFVSELRQVQANCFRAAAEMAKLNHADSEKGIVDSLVDKLEEQAKKLEAKA